MSGQIDTSLGDMEDEALLANLPEGLRRVLARSEDLISALNDYLAEALFDGAPRSKVALLTCSIADEHAQSLRVLMLMGNSTSSIALLRPQYEAVVRAIWLHFAASDEWIEKFTAPVPPNQKKETAAAKSVDEMIKGIAQKGPPTVAPQLAELKAAAWAAMNSFVHGGIHPVAFSAVGYPEEMLVRAVTTSNGLVTMSAMLQALLTGSPFVTKAIARIQPEFEDCLPPLIR